MRQVCVFRAHPALWWEYMSQFGEKCIRGNVTYNAIQLESCADDVLRGLHMDPLNVTRCMFNSFEHSAEADIDLDDSDLLRVEREEQLRMGVQ